MSESEPRVIVYKTYSYCTGYEAGSVWISMSYLVTQLPSGRITRSIHFFSLVDGTDFSTQYVVLPSDSCWKRRVKEFQEFQFLAVSKNSGK